MGHSSSIAGRPEGLYFAELVNPQQPPKEKQKKKSAVASGSAVSEDDQGGKAKGKVRCWVDSRASILKAVSWEKLWARFLSSPLNSFALSASEAASLLRECIDESVGSSSLSSGVPVPPTAGGTPTDPPAAPPSQNQGTEPLDVEAEIAKFLLLLEHLNEQALLETSSSSITGGSIGGSGSNSSVPVAGAVNSGVANPGGAKVVDFMALCSSVLLLSSTPFEDKIDQLFKWIVLADSQDEFGFHDFLVAMSSFERGLSNAMGKPACSENYVKKVATDWFALADPLHKASPTSGTKVSSKDFFEFCSNRQHIVRKLLEILSQSRLCQDKNEDIITSEIVTTAAEKSHLDDGPSGGDEWMANPAWKKTAERMVPKNLVPNSSKPSTTLDLEWVHGYRGFDCRNNIAFLNDSGTQFFFHSASLGVSQDSASNQQRFFGEHSDDIISMSVFHAKGSNTALVASGEMGKTPAIYIYEWSSATGIFSSKSTVKGFHTKGVCQLAFSRDGKYLFSVGVDYSVAMISTDQSKPASFGRMTMSSQGPKDKVLGCSPVGFEGGDFLSCGEKHCILWKTDRDKGSLQQVPTSLYMHKNKMFMSAVPGPKRSVVVGTSDGDIITLAEGPDSKGQLSSFIVCKKGSQGQPSEACVKLGTAAAAPSAGDKKGGPSPGDSVVRAHGKAVNAMWSSTDGTVIVSGGAEGRAIVWRLEAGDESAPGGLRLTKVTEFSPLTQAPIRSLCLNDGGMGKLLVGNMQGEVIEYKLSGDLSKLEDSAAGRVLNNGHFKDELWGLAVRPIVPDEADSSPPEGEYCTVGDDGFLRVWSAKKKKQVSSVNLGGVARCCAYSPDGAFLAVGFGGNVGKGKCKDDGNVRVYRTWKGDAPADLKPVSEFKEAKAAISCIRFSPDGTTLAVGARDNSVYLYSVTQQFKRKAKFSKHNAGILFFDFTVDGKYLQTCCSGYEILFCDTSTGVQLPNGATLLTDAEWATWSVTLGWATIGIWAGGMDGTDVNAADRSPSGKLLAIGDDFGKVKVYRYPATQEGGAQFVEYSGHSSHVTNTRWLSLSKDKKSGLPTDDYLVSVGGNDKCVFQWRNSGAESGGGGGGGSAVDEAAASSAAHADATHSGFDALDDAPAGGDEFTAVKAWLGAIVAPSAWAVARDTKEQKDKESAYLTALGEMSVKHSLLRGRDVRIPDRQAAVYAEVGAAAAKVFKLLSESGVNDSTAPSSDELELEWVHGYRGHDCRNNVYYADEQTVIYHAAALCVSVDLADNKQQFFRGHTDDIMSMAVRKQADGSLLVASGQQAVGNTYVWDGKSLKTLGVLKTGQKSINMLEFSKADGGRLLISIAEDKSVAVSDWRSQTVLANTKGEAAATYHIAALAAPGNLTFLSVGDKHLKLWALSGRNLTSTKVLLGGVKGPAEPPKATGAQTYWCCVEVKGHFVIGAEDSFLYVVNKEMKEIAHGFSAAATKKKDKGAGVTALYYDEARSLLLAGAKDGTITGWKVDDSPLKLKDAAGGAGSYLFQFNVGSVAGLLPHVIMAKQINALFSKPGPGDVVLLVSTRGCDLLQVDLSVPSAPKLYLGDKTSKGAPAPKGVLQRAHCNDELWGLACHPLLPQYVTVGDDKTLRFFCLKTKRMVRAVPLGVMSRCVAFNNTGALIALGTGGRVGKGKEPGGGLVRLYPAEHESIEREVVPLHRLEATPMLLPLEKLAEAKDAKEWISDIKFSADGRTLVAGAHDCKIYIYKVEVEMSGSSVKAAKLSLSKTFAKHNSVINHLDLSADGRFMQSTCSAYELLFCDTSTGKQITSASELKDVRWDTWTSTLGWPVQGIWAPGMDGGDINAVARSHSGHLLTSSDDFGKVRLLRYPCLAENSAALSYSGHSSHVTCVRWTAADECVISTGGNDKTIMQWRHTMSAGGASKAEEFDDLDPAFSVAPVAPHAAAAAAGGADDHHHDSDELIASGGDESGCVKPWLGAVRAPKNPPPVTSNAPAVCLDLKWVHGYTSAAAGTGNTRVSNNLFYNPDGAAVFPAAALGVVMSRAADSGALTQRYFRGHNDDILCLAASPCRRFVATGQTASHTSKGKGSICVWDARDCRLLSRMDQCHQRGVISLSFGPDSAELMSVGGDDKNTHILWRDAGGSWSRAQQTAVAVGDQNTVQFARWLSKDAQKDGDVQFVSGGNAAINFWKLEGATLTKKTGRFGSKKQVPLLSAANILTKDKDQKNLWAMVVGTATGDLYLYSGKDREAFGGVDKAHAGAVLCLSEGNKECTFICSGGKDKVLRVWNQALQRVSSFDMTKFSIVDAAVASIDVRPLKSAEETSVVLMAGTYGGEIIQLTSNADGAAASGKDPKEQGSGPGGSDKGGKGKDGTAIPDNRNLDLADAQGEVLVYSHYSGELWGCATHPSDKDIYATVGDDSTLRVWSVSQNRPLVQVPIGWPGRSVCWHPGSVTGQGGVSLLAVGFHEAVKGGVAKGGKKGDASKAKDGKKEDKGASSGGGGGGGGEHASASGPAPHDRACHVYSVRMNDAGQWVVEERARCCDSAAWIGDIKWSPLDGSMLAMGSHDKKLYAYDFPDLNEIQGKPPSSDHWADFFAAVQKKLDKPKFVYNKHSSSVNHFDFSLDLKFFQSICQANELLFAETGLVPGTTGGKQVTSATSMAEYNAFIEDPEEAAKGQSWASQTCKLGWPVQGIWPPGSSESDVNSCDRSALGKLLVTADDFGAIKVFSYPVVNEGSKFVQGDGHSSHVTCVRFSISDDTVISTGGNDKCVFVWGVREK